MQPMMMPHAFPGLECDVKGCERLIEETLELRHVLRSTRRFHTIKIQAFSMGSIAKLRNAVKCKANSFMVSPGITIYHQWSQTLLQHCSPGHHWPPHAIPHAMPHVMPHALPMPHPMAPAMPGEMETWIHPFNAGFVSI